MSVSHGNYFRFSPDELELAAKTIVFTLADNKVIGLEEYALAAVIVNRMHQQPEFGNTLAAICYHMPYWRGEVVGPRVVSNTTLYSSPRMRRALAHLLSAMDEPQAPLGGVTHYHWIGEQPAWAEGKTADLIIGRLLLYKGDADD